MQRLPSPSTGSDLHVSRRTFLQAATATAAGWGAATQAGLARSSLNQAVRRPARQAIVICLNGGPSQIDTWDPKPFADSSVRNFHPACQTSLPGVAISENLPGMAQRMHHVALVRSMHHDGAATHSVGTQLLLTGRSFLHQEAFPHWGSVASHLLGSTGPLPANVMLGGALGADFTSEGDGQTAAWLPSRHAPFCAGESAAITGSPLLRRALDVAQESAEVQQRYGRHDLGRMCLQARRLIERGSRVVTVNQFTSVIGRTTWDMHATGGRLTSTAADYRDILCPQLDQALCNLLDDLAASGLLSETIVAVCGEMGRSPQINRYGGRDHHTGAWSVLLAGGPIQAGQVIGSTDAHAEAPATRPVSPAELTATLFGALGINAAETSISGIDGRPLQVLNAEPVFELFKNS